MQITVIDVGQPNTHAGAGGRSYQSLEVTYKGNDGKVNSKKLMSFAKGGIYETAKTWSKGTVVDIITNKDDKGYWQWEGINVTGDYEVVQKSTDKQPATRVTGSNYETKEERAARQVMIVRQSSLSTAVASLAVNAKASPSAADVIAYAKELEAYVLGQGTDQAVDFDDDIPA